METLTQETLTSDTVRIDTLILEDQPRLASSYYQSLKGDWLGDVVEIAYNTKEAIRLIQGKYPPRKFLIDINLNSIDLGGIEVLRQIKKYCPESLVIVYSAHSVEKQCEAIGLPNLRFYAKDADAVEEHFEVFRKMIENFNKKIKKMKNTLITYYAQIAHIHNRNEPDGYVKLVCHYEGQKIEKVFQIEPIEAALADDFKINQWLKVTIAQSQSTIRMNFIKPMRVPVNIMEEDRTADVSDDVFINSRLWKTRS